MAEIEEFRSSEEGDGSSAEDFRPFADGADLTPLGVTTRAAAARVAGPSVPPRRQRQATLLGRVQTVTQRVRAAAIAAAMQALGAAGQARAAATAPFRVPPPTRTQPMKRPARRMPRAAGTEQGPPNVPAFRVHDNPLAAPSLHSQEALPPPRPSVDPELPPGLQPPVPAAAPPSRPPWQVLGVRSAHRYGFRWHHHLHLLLQLRRYPHAAGLSRGQGSGLMPH